jgi:hypothetical protein
MFIHWKKVSLSDRAYRDPYCSHAGPGRLTLTPLLKQSYREGGKPRNHTLWRPSRGIRICCVEDKNDPTTRVAWWQQFAIDFSRMHEALNESERAQLRKYHQWLMNEIALVVPRPLPEEEVLWFCMKSLPQTFRSGETFEQWRARLLHEARGLLEERRRLWWEIERDFWKRKAEPAQREPPREQTTGGAHAPGPKKAADTTPWFIRELGLTWPCTEAEVKTAWRRGAKERHPDHGGTNEGFIALKRAYDLAMEFVKARAVA